MVSIALLMIDHNDDIHASLPEVSGEPVLYHQIVQLRKYGISRFIVAVEKVDSKALSIAANLRQDGIEVEFVSRLAALSDMLGRDEPFLMVADGIWSADEHIKALIHSKTPEILTFQNDEKLSTYELIDLNYRWSGLARLNGELIASLDSLPEDSAVQSTLLRLALQRDYCLKNIEYAPSTLIKITDQMAADAISERQIKSSFEHMDVKGFFENIIFSPLASFAFRYSLRNKQIQPFIGATAKYSYLLFFMLAIVFALLNLSIISYSLAIIGCFCSFFKQVQHYLKPDADYRMAFIIYHISIFIILCTTAYHWQNSWSLSAAIIIFLLGYSIKILPFNPQYDRFILSFSDIFLLMIIAIIFDLQIYAMMMIAILYSLWIFVGAASERRHHS